MAASRRTIEEIRLELERMAGRSQTDKDRLSLLHDVSVYHEELLVQNEELTHTQALLEETRDRFIDLYEFAPNGYLTLNESGIVLQVNATASALFGRKKTFFEGLPLLGFFTGTERGQFLEYLRRCRTTQPHVTVEAEFRISRPEGDGLDVQLICRPLESRWATREYLVAVVDITDRKRLDAERAAAASVHTALALRLLSVQDEERQRIARDLHDDLGQQITVLRLKLEALAQGFEPSVVHEAQSLLQNLDERLHFMAAELRPATLDLGLPTALEHFVREWSVTFKIQGDFDASTMGDQRLPANIETQIYRVAQEALNNVAKHSGASHATVLLERQNLETVVLVVEDNGGGFDVGRVRSPHRLGLAGMRERALLVGGRLDIESTLGRGTTLFLHVPVRADRLVDPLTPGGVDGL
jgi:PAS domain S-box-containing protein